MSTNHHQAADSGEHGAGLNSVLRALQRATASGHAVDRDAVLSALSELKQIVAKVKAHDDGLNAREVAPTGDDYNALFSTLGMAQGPAEAAPPEVAHQCVAQGDVAALVSLVQQAAVPGGISEHEFIRPGGWLQRSLEVLSRTGAQHCATVSIRLQRIEAAGQFNEELLDLVHRVSGIADLYGAQTLADIYFLHRAILSGGYIEHVEGESAVTTVVQEMPSASRWLKHIQTV